MNPKLNALFLVQRSRKAAPIPKDWLDRPPVMSMAEAEAIVEDEELVETLIERLEEELGLSKIPLAQQADMVIAWIKQVQTLGEKR